MVVENAASNAILQTTSMAAFLGVAVRKCITGAAARVIGA
jgi:hypothetical protein